MNWIFQFISIFSLFLLLFIGSIILFNTIHKFYCTFWYYLWFQLYYLAFFFNIFFTLLAKSFQFQLNKLFQNGHLVYYFSYLSQKKKKSSIFNQQGKN